MAADLVLALCGLVVDRQVITGAPAWLKPAKFALSTMIAAWSFAFCIASTRIWPRVTRALDIVLAAALAIEIALIDMQAARGTTSHFNVATPFDGAVFAVMGVSILCIWLAMLLLTVVLFRQPYASPAWGWSLRLGMVLALIGTGSGGLMTVPNSQQLAEAHVSGRLPIAGAHTVGARGRGARAAGHGVERGSWRSAGGALSGDAWFAGAAAAGVVDRSPPFRCRRADSAGSHLCGGRQLPGAFRADFVAGFSGAIDCAT